MKDNSSNVSVKGLVTGVPAVIEQSFFESSGVLKARSRSRLKTVTTTHGWQKISRTPTPTEKRRQREMQWGWNQKMWFPEDHLPPVLLPHHLPVTASEKQKSDAYALPASDPCMEHSMHLLSFLNSLFIQHSYLLTLHHFHHMFFVFYGKVPSRLKLPSCQYKLGR